MSLPSNRLVLLALLPAMLAGAWLISKAQFYWGKRPEMQFGWAVLMLCAFLFWEAWPLRPKAVFRSPWLPVFLALPAAVLLFVVQIYIAALGMSPASLMGLAVGTMTIIFANYFWVFGWAGVRHFMFATLFFVIALPPPTVIYNPIVSTLQSWVVAIDVNVLSLMGVPAQRSGNLIQLPSGVVGVNEACSGIRSAQSTIMATLFIGYLVLKNTSMKVILLFVGLGLAIFGNVVRSLFLSLRADAEGIKAVEAAHDAAGWSILAFTTVGVALAAWWFAGIDKKMTALRERGRALRASRAA